MRKAKIEVELLEKGDRILLPDGEALVNKDEDIKSSDDRFYGEIEIIWIDHCRGKRGIDYVPRKNCSLIKNIRD